MIPNNKPTTKSYVVENNKATELASGRKLGGAAISGGLVGLAEAGSAVVLVTGLGAVVEKLPLLREAVWFASVSGRLPP
jgi:hypothetical protein